MTLSRTISEVLSVKHYLIRNKIVLFRTTGRTELITRWAAPFYRGDQSLCKIEIFTETIVLLYSFFVRTLSALYGSSRKTSHKIRKTKYTPSTPAYLGPFEQYQAHLVYKYPIINRFKQEVFLKEREKI